MLTADRFQQRISRRDNADGKQELYRRVEQIFLKEVDNVVFHFLEFTR